jgi:hypothetical protein
MKSGEMKLVPSGMEDKLQWIKEKSGEVRKACLLIVTQ